MDALTTTCSTCGAEFSYIAPALALGGLLAALPPICDSCTRVARARRVAEQQRLAEELGATDRIHRIRSALSLVPPRYRGDGGLDRMPGTVDRPEAIDEARGAIGAMMMLLTGPTGSGKSTLAGGVVGELVHRALSGDDDARRMISNFMWVSAGDLARARAEHRLGDGECRPVERAKRVRLLVLDDLGSERADRDGAIVDVLWARHEGERPTIVTTGLTRAQIVARYDAGLARRLVERQHSIVIRCGIAPPPTTTTTTTTDSTAPS